MHEKLQISSTIPCNKMKNFVTLEKMFTKKKKELFFLWRDLMSKCVFFALRIAHDVMRVFRISEQISTCKKFYYERPTMIKLILYYTKSFIF